MSNPFIAEIRIFSYNFAPKGWALCSGQLLSIAQNQALFSILGTTYGGNGVQTFALPDLRGRVPIHRNTNNTFTQGQRAGEENHTLLQTEMPAHNHTVTASSNTADQASPAGNYWASSSDNVFAGTANVAMLPTAFANAGGSQAHENRSPYLALAIGIALQGIFPSRN